MNASAATPADNKIVENLLPIKYEGFEVILDCRERAPIFFHYDAVFDSGNYKRKDTFDIDPNIPKECQQTSSSTYRLPYKTYASSGKTISYHRGHLVPANHLDYSPTAIAMSNFMTNIVPMTATVNAHGAWRETEEMTECLRERLNDPATLADGERARTFSVMGGVIWGDNKDNDYFINSHGVRTPDYLWKILYDSRADLNEEPSVIAWIIPNDNKAIANKLPKYRVSVRDIEARIGYSLPIKGMIKDLDDLPLWEQPKYCDRS
jgi:endonuclease G